MDSYNCISCGTLISPNSVFCFNCGIKIRCSACNAILVKGAKFCSECGASVEIKAESNDKEKNIVSYRNTNEGIFCDVSLTNEVGKEGIKELIQGLTTNHKTTLKQLNSSKDLPKDIDAEYTEAEDDSQDEEEDENDNSKKEAFPHINDVEIKVNCTESEWILIYAFYESEFASKTFSKKAVRDRYMKTRKTPARVKNYASNWKSLFTDYISTVNDTTYKFKTEKLDNLKKLILGLEKSATNGTKNFTESFKKTNNSSAKKNDSAKLVKRNPGSYTLRNDINFYPPDKISLKDFFGGFVPKGPEKLLLVVAYMQKILELQSIDVNCIYTAYKHIPLEIPNIKKALENIQKRQGWIDTKSYSDLKVSVAGENHIDFHMKKNNS